MQEAYTLTDETDNDESAFGQFKRMAAFVVQSESEGLSHSEVEEWLSREGRELQRLLLQEHLDSRSSKERRLRVVEGADGTERQSARSGDRVLGSVFGPVTLKRLLYQAKGAVGLSPLDAELNMPPSLYSYGMRRLVAEHAARLSFDEVVTETTRSTGVVVHKRQVEQLAQVSAEDFDAFYEQREVIGPRIAGDGVLVLTTDAKGIVVRKEDLRDATCGCQSPNSQITLDT